MSKKRKGSLYQELLSKPKKDLMFRGGYDDLKQLHKEGVPPENIADLFNMSEDETINTIKDIKLIEKFVRNTNNDSELNNNSKELVWDTNKIDRIAISLAHFIFRNGPVEDMHAGRHIEFSPSDSQLTDNDMEILNKYLVNRLAYAFKLLLEERWFEFYFLINSYNDYGNSWDKPNSDEGEKDNMSVLKEMLLIERRKSKEKNSGKI